MIKLAYPIGAPDIVDPFMGFHGDFADNLKFISETGYDAVELFLCSVESIPPDFREVLSSLNLEVACIGTTFPGKYEGLYLSSSDRIIRKAAVDRLKSFTVFAGEVGCPRISIGKMRGSSSDNPEAMDNLISSVQELCVFAKNLGVSFMIEPQNKKQLDYINTVGEGAEFLEKAGSSNLLLHLDTFHMELTEDNPSDSIRKYSDLVGFYHIAGPERRIPVMSDITFIDMLHEISVSTPDCYLSPEIKQIPDSRTVCRKFNDFMKSLKMD